MEFGTVARNGRCFMYRIQRLESEQRQRIVLTVTDFRGRRWTSTFTGKQLIDGLTTDIVPRWSRVYEALRDSVRHQRLDIDPATGMLLCPFEIRKGLHCTLRLPPKVSMIEVASDQADAEFALSLFHSWRAAAVEDHTSPMDISPEEGTPADDAGCETPAKPKRLIGQPKIVQSVSKRQKKKPRFTLGSS